MNKAEIYIITGRILYRDTQDQIQDQVSLEPDWGTITLLDIGMIPIRVEDQEVYITEADIIDKD